MKKLASALAVAALVGAPAIASAQGPVVYGLINTSLEYQDNGGSGTEEANGLNVVSRASRVGIRGGAPLEVGGLTAIYQIETVIFADQGGGTLADRDTFVGVRGDFGTLRIGRMVPPSTVLRARTDLFADQIGDARNGLASQTAFDLRVGNSIAYGGSFGPVGVDLFYATNLRGGVATDSDQAMFGAGLNYSQGPLFVGLTYEDHGEVFGSTPAAGPGALSDQSSLRLGASYRFGAFRVAGMAEMADWANDDSISVGAGLSWTQNRLTLKGQYYMTQWDDAEERDHSLVALGLEYALSNTTTVHVNYAMTMNDDDVARVPYAAGNDGTNGTVIPGVEGENASAFGVGLIHRF